ncbi:endonuclease G, mitochondrial-like [Mercenaria mercenaria]|uniref:endonuclease G, mitochondrial-like n=1 Tax=Mercenaria mercenaria TaxID=6596 RepID=UPI001E1D2D15|nr:endonuclease G, mitochondrial-like [Mercenaria mercenaria]
MFRGNILPFISACSVGIGAYLGSKYERYMNQPSGMYSNAKAENYFPWTLHASSLTPYEAKPSQGSAQNSNSSQIMKYGFPSLENVRVFDDYVLAYDKRNRNAHWVFEHLAPDKLPSKQTADRKKSNFFEDKNIHEKFRSYLNDYKYSGYDRGHLAAAGNHRHSQQAMDQTFTLSNISPQVGEGFNRGIWNNLEKYVRSIARKNRNTYVCTGPLYLPRREADGKMYVKYEVIGQNNVAVPTHFFKVVAIETNAGEIEILSFVLPNQPMKDDVPLKNFLTPLDAIERASGLLMFDKIPLNKVKLMNHQKPR